ncbi:uncharacterized protein [Engystomops pustulosus]|uniref:uncharacterized protein n=1 Tax=Engystomops pustulosus TaxID=76066 RepID=UPI003AFA791E
MKNKKTKNVDDQTRRKEHAQKNNVYGNVVEIKRNPVLNAAAEMNGASVTMDNYIGNDVYVNMDELNKEEQMIRTMKKGREPTVTKKESTSKIPKVRIIVAALILLVVLFLILIAITSVLFIYYLEMRKEVSHQKNLADNQERMNLENAESLENIKQNFQKDIKAINKTFADNQERMNLENAESLENIKQNFQKDIKAINKTFETICGKCPSGWLAIGVFCYYISTDTSSWDAAKDECIKKGATLLPLKTQEETAALHNFIKTDRYWIGMRRDKEPEKWKWLDGEMMSYSKWKSGEPNNPTTEECAESYYGEWNDLPCSRTLKYACKRGCCCC